MGGAPSGSDERGDGGAGGDDADDGEEGASESPSMAFLRDLAHVSDLAPDELGLDAGGDGEGGAEERAVGASGRFVIERRLGAGGFGTVYQALDRERGATVALKVLRRPDPRSLARFKSEFRSLVETVHTHLVQLYELHAEGGAWFFTMELVRGTDAMSYVRPPGAALDVTRLRSVLRQLAEALSFLHRTGKLHRDVKPSNVMVADDGRVVVVDFGLVGELADGQTPAAIVGTPAYMAPEQAAGLPVDAAADWYAVGVMLYQALTGRLPSPEAALGPTVPAAALPAAMLGVEETRRAGAPPVAGGLATPSSGRWTPAPRVLDPGVPADLDRLCVDLLAVVPARRPSAREVRARLAAARTGADSAARRRPPRSAYAGGGEVGFVGRAGELARLHEAVAAAERGAAVVVLLHGRSGMGKSALAQRFLAELRERAPARLALFGRCFAQESVPYKGVDALIDDLRWQLDERAGPELAASLPADFPMLARLFPALRGLAGAGAPRAADELDGPLLRQRAFAALRELVVQASPQVPVLVIDDLQWGDLDGAALLGALVQDVGSSRVDLQACKLEYSIVSPK